MTAHADGERWHVTTRRGEALGTVEWHREWRTYEFVPAFGCAFTPDCLRPLAVFCEELTKERLRAGVRT